MDRPLIHREEEFSFLFDLLSRSFDCGIGQSVYVSGMPGSGKTETVSRVLKKLKGQYDLFSCFLNCSMFKKKSILVALCKELRTKRDYLLKELKKKKSLLVLDEIDFVSTKKEMYALFDLVQNASLCIVSIANTVELSTKNVSTRIQSRIGRKRLNFRPYTHQELQDILGDKGSLCEFVSRKICAVSADARKAIRVWEKIGKTKDLSIKQDMAEVNVFLHETDDLMKKISLPKNQETVLSLSTREGEKMIEIHQKTRNLLKDIDWTFDKTVELVCLLARKGFLAYEKKRRLFDWHVWRCLW